MITCAKCSKELNIHISVQPDVQNENQLISNFVILRNKNICYECIKKADLRELVIVGDIMPILQEEDEVLDMIIDTVEEHRILGYDMLDNESKWQIVKTDSNGLEALRGFN